MVQRIDDVQYLVEQIKTLIRRLNALQLEVNELIGKLNRVDIVVTTWKWQLYVKKDIAMDS